MRDTFLQFWILAPDYWILPLGARMRRAPARHWEFEKEWIIDS